MVSHLLRTIRANGELVYTACSLWGGFIGAGFGYHRIRQQNCQRDCELASFFGICIGGLAGASAGLIAAAPVVHTVPTVFAGGLFLTGVAGSIGYQRICPTPIDDYEWWK